MASCTGGLRRRAGPSRCSRGRATARPSPRAPAGRWRRRSWMPDPGTDLWFRFFNEVGIIEQLARALLEARLPPPYLATHFAVLNHLVRVEDGRTPLQLARAFQVPKTTMTHTLAAPERGGRVALRPNPQAARPQPAGP